MNVGALNGKGRGCAHPSSKVKGKGAGCWNELLFGATKRARVHFSRKFLDGFNNLPVDPAKDLRVVGVGGAVGDPVGPVLREAVLLRHRLQPGRADRQLHHDVGLVGANVVAPQGRQRLIHAAGACRQRERGGTGMRSTRLLPKNSIGPGKAQVP